MANTRSKRKQEMKQTTLDESDHIETPPPKKSKNSNGQAKAKAEKEENSKADTVEKNTKATSNGESQTSKDAKALDGSQADSNGNTSTSKDKNVEDLECPPPGEGTLEKGSIAFFYRPKVDKEEASSVDDVQT